MNSMNQQRGFTLIEVMITVGVVVLAIVGVISTNIMIRQSVESAHERTLAFQDASRVIERMRDAANSGGSDFQAAVTGEASSAITSEASLPAANDQEISVSYVDENANPLDVTVTVTWNDRGLSGDDAVKTISIRSLITRRPSG